MDWGGFLRNKIWDTISGISDHKITDTDLVYFDASDITPERDWSYDEMLQHKDPDNRWQVRNQARMHTMHGLPPFSSTQDGISHWVETATAVAVKIDEYGKLRFLFCYGTDDLLQLIARPSPCMRGDLIDVFHARMAKKRWQDRWPMLKIEI